MGLKTHKDMFDLNSSFPSINWMPVWLPRSVGESKLSSNDSGH